MVKREKKTDLRLPKPRSTDATHTRGLQNKYMMELQELFKRYNIRIESTIPLWQKDDLSSFKTMLDSQAESIIYTGSPTIIRENITLAYNKGRRDAANNPRILRSTIKIPYDLNIRAMKSVENLIMRDLALLTNTTEEMNKNILLILSDDIRLGKGSREIAKDIRETIEGISKYKSESIARTETAYSYNQAASEAYQEAGLTSWQWLATMGPNTCEICLGKHGEVYKFRDEEPPQHPNCLCTLYPVVDKPFPTVNMSEVK